MLSSLKTQSPGTYAFWSLGFFICVGNVYFQSHTGGDGLQISSNTFSWIPLSLVLGFGLFQIVNRSEVQYSSLTLGLLIACVLLFLPALYPDSIDVTAVGRMYALAAGMLLFVGLQQLQLDNSKQSLLFFFILIAVITQAIFGYAQHFGLIPDNMLGYISNARSPWGIFRQPNVMASLMASGLVLSAFLLPVYAMVATRTGMLQATVCLLIPLFTVPVILLLNSRVGWMGATIGLLLLLPYLYAKAGKRVTICWLAMVILASCVGILLLSDSSGGFGSAAAKAQLDPVRMKMYPVVIRLALDQPLTGVGYGNFESSFNEFAAGLYAAGLAEPSGVDNLHHPHNELLFWTVEGGVVALAGLLYAAYLVFRTILRSESGYRLALIGLFLPIVLHTQTEYPFYHSTLHWILFVMLIYLADSLGNVPKVKPLKSTLLFGTAGVVIPVLTTAFMVTTLHASAILDRYERIPGTSPETLLSIVNPIVWRDRLVFTVRGNLMYAGLANGDTSQVQPFIDLTLASIASKPRWQRYQDLIFCYDFLNNVELADAALKEAQYRFPAVSFYRLEDGAFRLFTISPQSVESAAAL